MPQAAGGIFSGQSSTFFKAAFGELEIFRSEAKLDLALFCGLEGFVQ
jgi:hypothetical protein